RSPPTRAVGGVSKTCLGRRAVVGTGGLLVALSLSMGGLSGPAITSGAGERLSGPVPALVVSVLDGDTIEVRARIWLGQDIRTRVRLSDIDAPELRGECERERELAEKARAFLAARLGPKGEGPAEVRLLDIRYGKYAGRILARVETPGGEDLGRTLVAAGLARPYDGRSRAPWCLGLG
ncbi:MAG: thermonuclease family protein, partial [Kiloniellaceae bacterium]